MKQLVSRILLFSLVFTQLLSFPFSINRAEAAFIQDNNNGVFSIDFNNALGFAPLAGSLSLDIEHNTLGGTLKLEAPATTGYFTTNEIRPASFEAWSEIEIDGVFPTPSSASVEILDCSTPTPQPITTPGFTGLLPVPASGILDISALPTTVDCIRVRPHLYQNGAPLSPRVDNFSVRWDPFPIFLIGISGDATASVGDYLIYNVGYSLSYSDDDNAVIWVELPNDTNGMLSNYTGAPGLSTYGQDTNLIFVSAQDGGLYTASPTTINGVSIPAGSVYWDLGTVAAGTTDVVSFTVRARNGLESGITYEWLANVDADNAAAMTSDTDNLAPGDQPFTTTLTSSPNPSVRKDVVGGFSFGGNTYLNISGGSAVATYHIDIGSSAGINNIGVYLPSGSSSGLEDIFGSVVTDDLTDILATLQSPACGSLSSTAAISRVSNITPSFGAIVGTDIVWDYGSTDRFPIKTGRAHTFDVDFAGCANGTVVSNTVSFNGTNTNTVTDDLDLTLGISTTPQGAFAKGDDADRVSSTGTAINDSISITPGWDDNQPGSYNGGAYTVLPDTYGDMVGYYLLTANQGAVSMHDAVMIDKVPDLTSFVSATLPPNFSSTIYYNTGFAANAATNPPAFDYTNPTTNGWTNTVPSPASDVEWVAFHVDCIPSQYFPSPLAECQDSSGGQLPSSVRADMFVLLDPVAPGAQCTDYTVDNIGVFAVNETADDLTGATVSALGSPLTYTSSIERTYVAPEAPNFDLSTAGGSNTANAPGNVSYTLTIRNDGLSNSFGTDVVIQIPQVDVNGVTQYLGLANATTSNGIIDFSQIASGIISIDLGTLPIGNSETIDLSFLVPNGVLDGELATLNAQINGNDANGCGSTTKSLSRSTILRSLPTLEVTKDVVEALVITGDDIHYAVNIFNEGPAPSTGTYIVDPVPDFTVFKYAYTSGVDATGQAFNCTGCTPYFSDGTGLAANILTTANPISGNDIQSYFSPGIPTGTPGQWTSPYGINTQYVAWNVDQAFSPPIFPVGQTITVGVTVTNDHDGPGPSTLGSTAGQIISNYPAVVSNELLQAVGNQVFTTVLDNPGLRLDKSSSLDETFAGGEFDWYVDFYNDSGSSNTVTTLTDTLPAGVTFLDAFFEWNPAAVANGMPSGEFALTSGGVSINPALTISALGATLTPVLSLDVAQGLRAGNLATTEGGRLRIRVISDSSLTEGHVLINNVEAFYQNPSASYMLSDSDDVRVEKPDLAITKFATNPSPVAGDTYSYLLQVSNYGSWEAPDTQIIDTLPEGICYVPGSTFIFSPGWTLPEPVVTGSCTAGGGGETLTWDNVIDGPTAPAGVVPPGSLLFINYNVVVDNSVAAGDLLTNTATVSTTLTEIRLDNNTDDATVMVPFPDLAVTKTAPASVAGGSIFSYDVSYRNNSPQYSGNVFVVDALPDFNANASTNDVTFVSAIASHTGETLYYYDQIGQSGVAPSVPPTTGGTSPNTFFSSAPGWTLTPGTRVSHIAIVPDGEDMAGLEGPYSLTISVEATDSSGAPAAVSARMINEVTVQGDDEQAITLTDNTDTAETRVPGYDLFITKTGSSEGIFPGVAPGGTLDYAIEFGNQGTQSICAVYINDVFPADYIQGSPADNFSTLSLQGGLLPVDPSGTPITTPVTVERVGNTWYIGTQAGGANVCLPPNSIGTFSIFGTIDITAEDFNISGTTVFNTISIDHNDPTANPEDVLTNNTDTSETVVYKPDLFTTKVGYTCDGNDCDTPGANDPYNFTDKGAKIRYEIEYGNIGNIAAENPEIIEHIPNGVCYTVGSLETNLPQGTIAEYSDNGGTSWNYSPIIDSNGNDCAVTHFRVRWLVSVPAPSTFDQESCTLEDIGLVDENLGARGVNYNVSEDFIADIDNDGHLDIVSLQTQDRYILWGHGDGTFTRGSFTTSTNAQTFTSQIIDFDNDGNLDILIGFYDGGDPIHIYFGDGNRRFTQLRVGLGLNRTIRTLKVADLDNDGFNDIAVGRQAGTYRGLSIFYNNGDNATFTHDTSYSVSTPIQPVGLTITDVNNDTNLDIIMTDMGNRLDRIYIGDGTGNFTLSSALTTPNSNTVGLDVGDVNNDGNIDILTTRNDQSDSLWIGDGTGNFTETFLYENNFNRRSYRGNIVDFDQDGDEDVIMVNSAIGALTPADPVEYWVNDGTGNLTFNNTQFLGVQRSNPTALGIADFDEDGKNDLFIGENTNNVRTNVWLSSRSSNYISTCQFQGSFAGTTDKEIAPFGSINSNFTTGYQQKITLGSGGRRIVPTGRRTAPNAIQVADLNNNGLLDTLVVPGTGTLQTDGYIYYDFDPNTETIASTATGIFTGGLISDAILGNFNNDGLLDVATASYYGGVNNARLNNGAGNFVYNDVLYYSHDLDTIDIDNDGIVDIILGRGRNTFANTDKVAVQVNDGTGDFTTEALLNIDGPRVKLSDVDGDGDADVIQGNTEEVYVYINDGAYNYTLTTASPLSAIGDFDMFDYDQDGDEDIVGVSGSVHENIGGGNFTFNGNALPAGYTGLSGSADHSHYIDDFDGDGDVDYIVKEGTTWGDVLTFINDGNGNWEYIRNLTFGGLGVKMFDVADMTADGIPDIVGVARVSGGGAGSGELNIWEGGLYYADTGTYVTAIESDPSITLQNWGRLLVEQDVPQGTDITYSIYPGLPVGSSGSQACVGTPLIANASGANGFIDMGTIPNTNTNLCLEVSFSTTNREITPSLDEWTATYSALENPSFTFDVQVEDDTLNVSTIDNLVQIQTITPEITLVNNQDTYTHVVRESELELTKDVDLASANAGDILGYTIEICNNGPHDATNVIVDDVLPVDVTYNAGTAVPAPTSTSPLEWTYATLATGACETITLDVTITGPVVPGDDLVNNACVDSDQYDSVPDNNCDTAITVIADLANVYVEKTGISAVNTHEGHMDEAYTYTITYGNNGNIDADNVVISDALDPKVKLPDPDQDGIADLTGIFFAPNTTPNNIPLACAHAGGTPIGNGFSAGGAIACIPASTPAQCTDTGNTECLPPGESGFIQITVIVGPDTVPTFINQPGIINPPDVVFNDAFIETTTNQTNTTDDTDDHDFPVELGSLANVSGYVHLDPAENNERDLTDPGIDNVPVALFGQDIFGETYGVDKNTYPALYDQYMNLIGSTLTSGDPYPANYTVIPVNTTDMTGLYSYSALIPGVYQLLEASPLGYFDIGSNAGASTGPTGNGIGTAEGGIDPDQIINVTLSQALTSSENNFAENLGIIEGEVFYDMDVNGSLTAGDFGLPSVQVTLYDELGDPVTFAYTDGNGFYQFTDLPVDDGDGNAIYTVVVTDNLGIVSALTSTDVLVGSLTSGGADGVAKVPAGYNITLTPTNTNDALADFGYDGPVGRIGQKVYFDSAANGFFDGTDSPIQGAIVDLYRDMNSNGVYDPTIDVYVGTEVTDINGDYFFTNLIFDDYVVVVNTGGILSSLSSTHQGTTTGLFDAQDPTGYGVSLTALPGGSEDLTANYGFTGLTGAIGNHVFFDTNNDGEFAGAEVGIPNVEVSIYRDNNRDQVLDAGDTLIAIETTDANGEYFFTNLILDDGTGTNDIYYIVEVTDSTNQLAGMDNTYNPGVNNGLLYGNERFGGALNVGEEPTGYPVLLDVLFPNDVSADFGYLGAEVAGTVFYDFNDDGDYDNGTFDTGISGVEITLYADYGDGNGFVIATGVTATTTTDANGDYTFINLAPQTTAGTPIVYQARVTNNVPAGYTSTHTLVPSSTVDGESKDPAGYTFDIVTNLFDPTADFGYTPPLGTIGNLGFYDYNFNGSYDSGAELPIVGLDVALVADYGDGNGFVAITSAPPTAVTPATTTDTTDTSGLYEFTDLPLEYYDASTSTIRNITYQVQVTGGTPAGFVSTHTLVPGSTTDGDAKNPAGYTTSMTISATAADQVDTTADFGYGAQGSIGDFTFLDGNADGIFNGSDTALSGITLSLLADLDHDGTYETLVANHPATPASGAYLFSGINIYHAHLGAQTSIPYRVIVTGGVPVGLISAHIRVPGSTTNNEAKDADNGYDVTLNTATPNNLTADFGFMAGGEVGDLVFFDSDGDGFYDPLSGDYGIASVVVELFHDGNGDSIIDVNNPLDFLATTTTDVNGNYLFDGLAVDDGSGSYDYTVRVINGPAIAPFDHTTGSVGVNNHSQNQFGYTVTLTPSGLEDYTADFGYTYQFSGLSGYVFNDVDQDVIFDPTELAMNGIDMFLYGLDSYGNIYGPDKNLYPALYDQVAAELGLGVTNTDPYPSTFVVTTPETTDATGYYVFTNLLPGIYSVIIDPSINYSLTGSNAGDNLPIAQNGEGSVESGNIADAFHIVDVLLNSGQISTFNNFGLIQGIVAGTVFTDVNGNGILETGDAGIANVEITLYQDLTGDGLTVDDIVVGVQNTDSAGDYLFDNLLLNQTYISVVSDSAGTITGYTHTVGTPGLDNNSQDEAGYDMPITLTSFQNTTGDFGYTLSSLGTIGDTVFYDVNGNGDYEPGSGDTGIANVTLELYDQFGVLYDTTTSDLTGNYLFLDVPFGTYTVQVTDPFGVLSTFTSTHTAGGTDAQNPAGYSVVVNNANPSNLTADFGYTVSDAVPTPDLGVVGNSVWSDNNGNGIQDIGETGIPGVTVEIRNSSNVVLGTQTTDANGEYEFTGLPDNDTYTVIVTDTANLLSGINSTHGLVPGSTTDGEAKDPTGYSVTLTPVNNTDLTADFGYDTSSTTGASLGSIGDTVYYDADSSGDYNAGDTPIANVEVTLYDSNGFQVGQMMTDINGEYLFSLLPYGDYTVVVTDSANTLTVYQPTTIGAGSRDPMGYTTTLDSFAPNDLTADFGYILATTVDPLGEIFGTVWSDTNGNGTLESTEGGIGAVTIELRDSNNIIVATTQTDTAGDYAFPGLPLNETYTVIVTDTFTVVATLTPTVGVPNTPNESQNPTGTNAIITNLQPTQQVDFGYDTSVTGGNPSATVGNKVFYDGNQNGTFDGGDLPMGGVEITLYTDTNNDGTPDGVFGTTFTNTNGEYYFNQVPFGTYIAAVTDSLGLTVQMLTTHTANGGNSTADNDAKNPTGYQLTVSAGNQSDLTADFGYVNDANIYGGVLGFIGDQVWEDTDGDGTRDIGEPGIAGITIDLYANGLLIATTTTDANGEYSFENLATDDGDGDVDYGVVVTDTSNILGLHTPTLGIPNTNDEAQDGSGFPITLTPAFPSVMYADFGYEPIPLILGEIGDYVWYDADQNGIQDSGESGVPNVEVTLYNAGGTPIAVTVTDINGNYQFTNIPPGDYEVVVTDSGNVLLGHTATSGPESQDPSGYMVTVDAVTTVIDDADFGFSTDPVAGIVGEIGNHVWLDQEQGGGNGQYNLGVDDPVSGAVITLYRDLTGNGLTPDDIPVGTQTTDTVGEYYFTNLPINTDYVVVVTSIPDQTWLNTRGTVGMDEHGQNPFGYPVRLTTATPNDMTADFSYEEQQEDGEVPPCCGIITPPPCCTITPPPPNPPEEPPTEQPPVEPPYVLTPPTEPFQPSAPVEIPQTGALTPDLLAAYGAESLFIDMNVTDAYYGPMAGLVQQGYVVPEDNDFIRPERVLHGSELAKALILISDKSTPRNFDDNFEALLRTESEWFQPYVSMESGNKLGFAETLPGSMYVTLEKAEEIIVRAFDIKSPVSYISYAGSDNAHEIMVDSNILPAEMRDLPGSTVLTRAEGMALVYRAMMMTRHDETRYTDTISVSIPGLNIQNVEASRTGISHASEWISALNNGSGFTKDTRNGHEDHILFFAHSTDEYGRPDVFYPVMKELTVGDFVEMNIDGVSTMLEVTSRQFVPDTDIDALMPEEPSALTLVTCDWDVNYRWVFTTKKASE